MKLVKRVNQVYSVIAILTTAFVLATGMTAHASTISIDTCYKLAEEFGTTSNRDDARYTCFRKALATPSLATCFKAAAKFEMNDNRDDGTWSCFNKYSETVGSVEGCMALAKELEFSDSQEAAKEHCFGHYNSQSE